MSKKAPVIQMQRKPTATRRNFPKIEKRSTPDSLLMFQALGQLERDFTVYMMGRVQIFLGIDDGGKHHLSIAHPKRYPTWDEIVHIRYELIPDNVTMALILPSMAEYINVHEHCFQLNEIAGNAAEGDE